MAIFFSDARPRHPAWDHAGDWTITYDRILLSVGDIDAPSITGAGTLAIPALHVVDLLAAPRAKLAQIEMVAEGTYGPLAFSIESPSPTSPALAYVDPADRDAMSKDDVSLVIEGNIADPKGVACNPSDPGTPAPCAPVPVVTFRWRLPVTVLVTKCDTFDVMRSTATDVNLHLAIDAWFRTGFTTAVADLPRAAQWVADADLDRDGETTLDELKAIPAATLFSKELGFDLAAAPIPISTAYDFLLAQAMMLAVHDPPCASTPRTPLAQTTRAPSATSGWTTVRTARSACRGRAAAGRGTRPSARRSIRCRGSPETRVRSRAAA